jgi:hypothetical protein
MRDVRALLLDAGQIYDEPAHGLQAASHAARWRGFGGGAAWMRSAMGAVRGKAPLCGAPLGWLGACKYMLAGSAALLALAALWRVPVLAMTAAVVAFYAVEARMVFVFPLALDGEPAPFVASHRLVARTSPPGVATARVMRIAARMLFGSFVGRGFLRSWCLGCLAVVLWYEDARQDLEARA